MKGLWIWMRFSCSALIWRILNRAKQIDMFLVNINFMFNHIVCSMALYKSLIANLISWINEILIHIFNLV